MTVKELIKHLKKMPQDKRVYVWYEGCDCDILLESLVYDGQEVCLWSDTGELAYTIGKDGMKNEVSNLQKENNY